MVTNFEHKILRIMTAQIIKILFVVHFLDITVREIVEWVRGRAFGNSR